jgi:2-methylcitrate dehydratase PrpD
MTADNGDLARMRLGVLHASGIAFANAAESGIDIGIAAVLSGNSPVNAPVLPFPCRRETHGYIEAIYMLREETSLHDDEVEGIACAVTQQTLAALGRPGENADPQTSHEARNSLPYCVAASLILNRINHAAFAPEAIRNPRILALARKVSCIVDPQLAEDESRITVTRTRGKPVECTVTVPLGAPNNEMTPEQVRERFRDDMSFAGCGEFAEAAIAAVDRMTSVTDTQELRAVLQNARYSAKR